MLLGLQMMEDSAKRAFCEELSLPHNEGQDLDKTLIAWMAQAVSVSPKDPAVVELTVLRWLAVRLSLTQVDSLAVDELEAAVRRKIAEDSHDFLFPFMEVGSAVAYIGPKKVVGPKLELLESSTAGLIPSHAARDRMRQDWQARGAALLGLQDSIDVDSLLEHLEVPVSILKLASETTRAAVMVLSFAVALSDGRLEVEEEHFAEALARELNLSPERVAEIKAEVNQAFWRHLAEIGGSTNETRNTGQSLTLYMRAAQMALESCGSLASFSAVVERGFVGSIHDTMSKGAIIASKMKTWGRTPLRIPLGFATGMLCYIRDIINSDDSEALFRLSLAAIYRQHLDMTGEHADISIEDVGHYVPEPEVENPADILAETVVGRGKTEAVRKITLEPLKFEDPTKHSD